MALASASQPAPGLPGSLRAFVVLCLLADGCRSAEPDPKKVDINNLARIIQFFEDNYKKVVQGGVRQYAVAINVPENQCKNFVPNQTNLPTGEEATNVKNLIYNRKVALYEGNELIAAGTIKTKSERRHSEGILLNPPVNAPNDPSPMENLLNRKKDACVVFYTYSSPCAETCLNVSNEFNILKALENWSKRPGLKAFVFKDIWRHNKEPEVLTKIKLITKYVPLYRCVSSNKCYECLEGDNINQNCMQSQPTRHHGF